MHLKHIYLTLARNPDEDILDAERDQHYVITAPLNADGHVDEVLWKTYKDKCEARHIQNGRADRIGKLTHFKGAWRLHYPGEAPSDDEVLFDLGSHCFLPGEYVTVNEPDGDTLTYRVDKVEKGPLLG